MSRIPTIQRYLEFRHTSAVAATGGQFSFNFLGQKNNQVVWLRSVKAHLKLTDGAIVTMPHVSVEVAPLVTDPQGLMNNMIDGAITIGGGGGVVQLYRNFVFDELTMYRFEEGDFLIQNGLSISWAVALGAAVPGTAQPDFYINLGFSYNKNQINIIQPLI